MSFPKNSPGFTIFFFFLLLLFLSFDRLGLSDSLADLGYSDLRRTSSAVCLVSLGVPQQPSFFPQANCPIKFKYKIVERPCFHQDLSVRQQMWEVHPPAGQKPWTLRWKGQHCPVQTMFTPSQLFSGFPSLSIDQWHRAFIPWRLKLSWIRKTSDTRISASVKGETKRHLQRDIFPDSPSESWTCHLHTPEPLYCLMITPQHTFSPVLMMHFFLTCFLFSFSHSSRLGCSSTRKGLTRDICCLIKDEDACPPWGSNSGPSDYETDALPTALRGQMFIAFGFENKIWNFIFQVCPSVSSFWRM